MILPENQSFSMKGLGDGVANVWRKIKPAFTIGVTTLVLAHGADFPVFFQFLYVLQLLIPYIGKIPLICKEYIGLNSHKDVAGNSKKTKNVPC